MLQGDEAFKCEVCKEATTATKRMRIHRLPRCLLLHMKRFKYDTSSREKVASNVNFPLKVTWSTPLPNHRICHAEILSLITGPLISARNLGQPAYMRRYRMSHRSVRMPVALPGSSGSSTGRVRQWCSIAYAADT